MTRHRPTQAVPPQQNDCCCWPARSRAALGAGAVAIALGLGLASDSLWTGKPAAPVIAPRLVLDPNTAPSQVLSALPNVGPALVRRMIAVREERPILSLEDVGRRVRGLGPVGLARIAPHLRLKARSDVGDAKIATAHGRRPKKTSRALRGKLVTTEAATQPVLQTPLLARASR
jgi:hypothetical protein